MRAGLHNIMDGFINGLTIAFQSIEQGFVRALHTGAPAGADDLLLETSDHFLLETGDLLLLE